MSAQKQKRIQEGRVWPGFLMWLLGVPIPVIIILWLLTGGFFE